VNIAMEESKEQKESEKAEKREELIRNIIQSKQKQAMLE